MDLIIALVGVYTVFFLIPTFIILQIIRSVKKIKKEDKLLKNSPERENKKNEEMIAFLTITLPIATYIVLNKDYGFQFAISVSLGIVIFFGLIFYFLRKKSKKNIRK